MLARLSITQQIKVNIMNKIQKSMGCLLLATSIGGVQASTLDAQVGTNIDAFDVFVKNGVSAGVDKTVSNVNEFNLSGWILSDFGTGAPSLTNSTFTDYILVTTTAMSDAGGSVITSTGLNNTYQLTALIEATGKITNGATGAFTFTGLNSFGLYVDTGFTNAQFTGNLGNFTDGSKVMTGGSLVNLTGLPPSNVGILNPTLGANGEFNLQFQWLQDLVDGQTAAFLRGAGTATSLFDLYPNILSLTAGEVTNQASDINGVKTGSGTSDAARANNIAIMNNFETFFGVTGGAGVTLFQVRSTPDTNLASHTVPEPNMILLMGAGLLGLAGFSSTARRKKVA